MRAICAATLVTVLLACDLAAPVTADNQHHCDEKQDQWFHRPDPKTWNALYTLYKEFGGCDDGGIAEGFSDDVAQLFLGQWTDLGSLNRLFIADKSFKEFVLRHIDATLDESQLKGIASNAKSHCPAWGARLCRSVESRANRGVRELSKQGFVQDSLTSRFCRIPPTRFLVSHRRFKFCTADFLATL